MIMAVLIVMTTTLTDMMIMVEQSKMFYGKKRNILLTLVHYQSLVLCETCCKVYLNEIRDQFYNIRCYCSWVTDP